MSSKSPPGYETEGKCWNALKSSIWREQFSSSTQKKATEKNWSSGHAWSIPSPTATNDITKPTASKTTSKRPLPDPSPLVPLISRHLGLLVMLVLVHKWATYLQTIHENQYWFSNIRVSYSRNSPRNASKCLYWLPLGKSQLGSTVSAVKLVLVRVTPLYLSIKQCYEFWMEAPIRGRVFWENHSICKTFVVEQQI